MCTTKQNARFHGVYPTMVTPYREDGKVDYDRVEKLVEWYITHKADGIFAVCQSSEMELLTRAERAQLCRVVVKAANGRVPVVVSGHVSDSPDDQLRDAEAGMGSGCDAYVLVSNRFALGGDFIENLERFISRLDASVPLGLYECPSPFKRLLIEEELRFVVSTNRFQFFKDTCCDPELLKTRAQITAGSGVNLFNANAATLLESLLSGAAGYCGVMANFHPELYAWLCTRCKAEPAAAKELSDFLSICSMVETRLYPSCAKQYLSEEIMGFCSSSRRTKEELPPSFLLELQSIRRMTERMRNLYEITL